MKLRDALLRVVKGKDNEGGCDVQGFCRALNLEDWLVTGDGWSKFDAMVKGWYLESWMCSDTEVGLCAYFFDDELIAYSTKSARKADTHLMFMSQAAADKVREFILSLISPEDLPRDPIATDEQLDEEFDPDNRGGQVFVFYNQILHHQRTGFILNDKGEREEVKVVGNGVPETADWIQRVISKRVVVEHVASGKVENIELDRYVVPWPLLDETPVQSSLVYDTELSAEADVQRVAAMCQPSTSSLYEQFTNRQEHV